MPAYDAIVCGAGPAGSTAARVLASEGYKVLLVEKAVLPRYKACGGGLTKKCYDLIDVDISDIVEDRTYKMVFTNGFSESIVLESEDPWIYMVKRELFDTRLVQEAQQAGVELRQGEEVIDVAQQENGVKVVTRNAAYIGKYLIAADGVFSVVGKKLGLKKRYGIALEAEVFVGDDVLNRYRGCVKVDFSAIRGGYAWVFPKSDSLSVGIGTFTAKGNNLRHSLHRFMEREGIHPRAIATLKGHPIALNDGSFNTLLIGRILLVGDAAMLTDPFTGEGIYYAIKSGIVAGRCVAQALLHDNPERLKRYVSYVKKELIGDIRVASFIAGICYRDFDRVFSMLKRHPYIMDYFADLVKGNDSYKHMPFRIVQRAIGLSKFKGLGRSSEI